MNTNASVGDLLAGRDWFRLQPDAGNRAAVLHIYGTIGSDEWWDDVASPSLVRELDALDVDSLTVYVNSPGGIADDGIAIMNAFARNKAKVTAHVDGLAASAASIVILGADEIVMGAGSRLMIHDAWSIAIGQASEIRKSAERLDKLSQNLATLYAQRAGGAVEEWRAAMVEETWYTAEEAVEAGLADRVAPMGADADDAPRNVIPIADAARAFGWRHPGREAASAPFIPRRAATAAAPMLPSSTEPGDPIRKENVVAYDDLKAGLAKRLGVPDADASDEMLLAALEETLNEQAEETTTESEAENEIETPAAAALPEGTVAIDATVLAQLQQNALRGAEARAEQDRARRDSIIATALAEGRISSVSKDTWRAQLDTSEASTTVLLNSLAKNTIPVEEIGHASADVDTDAYPAHWKR